MAEVRLDQVTKRFPSGVTALSNVSLEVREGECFVLVGPSGSGKSTLLRLIAGLEAPTTGQVFFNGDVVDDRPPRQRDVALVFQNPALYPHLNVFENLAFGLRARRYGRAEIQTRVQDMAERLGLSGLLARAPSTLSGGERQRVALGRALVRQPAVFLLDEPFSSLDIPLRRMLRAELIDLQRKLGTTTIHVTHDQAEGMALGHRMAIMNQGTLIQVGTPQELYQAPATRFVAAFLGSPPMNLITCELKRTETACRVRVLGLGLDPDESFTWKVESSSPWLAPLQSLDSDRVLLGIRPEQVELVNTSDRGSSQWILQGQVQRIEPAGHENMITLNLGSQAISVRMPPERAPRPSERVTLGFRPDRITWFDEATGRALRPRLAPVEPTRGVG